VPIKQPTIQEPRQSWLAAANAISKITPVEPVWCVHSADPRCPRPGCASPPSWLAPSDSSMSITHDAKLSPSTWAVVLAAGDGSRLSTLTRDSAGVPVPKQFCSLRGGVTLLSRPAIGWHRAVRQPASTNDVVAGTYRFKKDEEEYSRFQPRSSRDAYRDIRGVQR
jgi:hypothetical protein